MNVYAVVSISGGDKSSMQKTKTPADHDGGSNPAWGFPMKFTVEEAALQQNRLVLDFKLVCERALGDKHVGDVHVPIKELVDSSPAKGGKGKFVSYQVRKPSGKPKGHLTFSYQFIGKSTISTTVPPPPPVAKAHGGAVTVYPVVGVGSSSGYPPAGYYPPLEGYGYLMPGYGYPPAPAGYSYPVVAEAAVQQASMTSGFGVGLGGGLLGGAIGGLLIGDV
ncbi:hypothetical protein PHJA_002558800 [Phtheirospermum japonicum]|uniref:C2 domain-containing protein n=1 Tax=Phtheirospermum japonicum TaxID=374723 RepID=A0A830D2N9_9LAMI|nr:hypothetical protein PHJA_002558800 [Phtheirospermum japonicum]